jgi:fucose 4-O-acetylase-like acetyltransferase
MQNKMKTLKSILVELILPFILCWFFMSVLVDIVAIPTIFKNISNLEEGGRIGMTVFGRFNCFEIFFAVSIFLGLVSYKEKSKFLISLSILLLGLSLFYTFFMTPMIANTSIQIHQLAPLDPRFEILQKQHNYYHILYRYFDTAKLLVLLVFAGMVTRLNIKKIHKECV